MFYFCPNDCCESVIKVKMNSFTWPLVLENGESNEVFFFFIINGLNAKEMHGFVHESVCIVDLICSVFKWEQWGIGWIMTMRVENGDGEEA